MINNKKLSRSVIALILAMIVASVTLFSSCKKDNSGDDSNTSGSDVTTTDNGSTEEKNLLLAAFDDIAEIMASAEDKIPVPQFNDGVTADMSVGGIKITAQGQQLFDMADYLKGPVSVKAAIANSGKALLDLSINNTSLFKVNTDAASEDIIFSVLTDNYKTSLKDIIALVVASQGEAEEDDLPIDSANSISTFVDLIDRLSSLESNQAFGKLSESLMKILETYAESIPALVVKYGTLTENEADSTIKTTFTLTEKSIVSIFTDLFTDIENDKNIEDAIKAFAELIPEAFEGTTADEVIKEFKDMIKEASEEMDPGEEKFTIEIASAHTSDKVLKNVTFKVTSNGEAVLSADINVLSANSLEAKISAQDGTTATVSYSDNGSEIVVKETIETGDPATEITAETKYNYKNGSYSITETVDDTASIVISGVYEITANGINASVTDMSIDTVTEQGKVTIDVELAASIKITKGATIPAAPTDAKELTEDDFQIMVQRIAGWIMQNVTFPDSVYQ